MRASPLHAEHLARGARMTEFAGWQMPAYFTSIIEESNAVRETAGLFDLTHMGEIRVTGKDAWAEVNRLTTNDVNRLQDNDSQYTLMCNDAGGILEDLIVAGEDAQNLFMVVNAARKDFDVAWIREHIAGQAQAKDISDQLVLLALQGPQAETILRPLVNVELTGLGHFRFIDSRVAGLKCRISRTGYTGEDGFELFFDVRDGERAWDRLTEALERAGGRLCGLGARDLLRLEAGYILWGQDVDETTNPYEAGLGWTVRMQKGDFVGRQALERAKKQGVWRKLVAVRLDGSRVPRRGALAFRDTRMVGEITSGSFSPATGTGIGMSYLLAGDSEPGTKLEVELAGKRLPAEVVARPMYKRTARCPRAVDHRD